MMTRLLPWKKGFTNLLEQCLDSCFQTSKQSIIGTRWVFRNKLNEQGKVVRKKTRLVAQGYNQKKCIDFTEIFAAITRLEAIRIMLAFSTYKNIKFFQMNVKSAFLNGFIEEEMYVRQPPSFEDHTLPDHAFEISKGYVWSKTGTPCLV